MNYSNTRKRLNSQVASNLVKVVEENAIITMNLGNREFIKYTKPFMIKYSKKTNSKLIIIDKKNITNIIESFPKLDNITIGRSNNKSYLYKVLVIIYYLNIYNKILWVDDTCFIKDTCINLFEVMEDNEILAYNEGTNKKLNSAKNSKTYIKKVTGFSINKNTYINSGVVLYSKNVLETLNIDNILNYKQLFNNNYPHQSFLNFIIQYYKLKIKFLPSSYNRMLLNCSYQNGRSIKPKSIGREFLVSDKNFIFHVTGFYKHRLNIVKYIYEILSENATPMPSQLFWRPKTTKKETVISKQKDLSITSKCPTDFTTMYVGFNVNTGYEFPGDYEDINYSTSSSGLQGPRCGVDSNLREKWRNGDDDEGVEPPFQQKLYNSYLHAYFSDYIDGNLQSITNQIFSDLFGIDCNEADSAEKASYDWFSQDNGKRIIGDVWNSDKINPRVNIKEYAEECDSSGIPYEMEYPPAGYKYSPEQACLDWKADCLQESQAFLDAFGMTIQDFESLNPKVATQDSPSDTVTFINEKAMIYFWPLPSSKPSGTSQSGLISLNNIYIYQSIFTTSTPKLDKVWAQWLKVNHTWHPNYVTPGYNELIKISGDISGGTNSWSGYYVAFKHLRPPEMYEVNNSSQTFNSKWPEMVAANFMKPQFNPGTTGTYFLLEVANQISTNSGSAGNFDGRFDVYDVDWRGGLTLSINFNTTCSATTQEYEDWGSIREDCPYTERNESEKDKYCNKKAWDEDTAKTLPNKQARCIEEFEYFGETLVDGNKASLYTASSIQDAFSTNCTYNSYERYIQYQASCTDQLNTEISLTQYIPETGSTQEEIYNDLKNVSDSKLFTVTWEDEYTCTGTIDGGKTREILKVQKKAYDSNNELSKKVWNTRFYLWEKGDSDGVSVFSDTAFMNLFNKTYVGAENFPDTEKLKILFRGAHECAGYQASGSYTTNLVHDHAKRTDSLMAFIDTFSGFVQNFSGTTTMPLMKNNISEVDASASLLSKFSHSNVLEVKSTDTTSSFTLIPNIVIDISQTEINAIATKNTDETKRKRHSQAYLLQKYFEALLSNTLVEFTTLQTKQNNPGETLFTAEVVRYEELIQLRSALDNSRQELQNLIIANEFVSDIKIPNILNVYDLSDVKDETLTTIYDNDSEVTKIVSDWLIFMNGLNSRVDDVAIEVKDFFPPLYVGRNDLSLVVYFDKLPSTPSTTATYYLYSEHAGHGSRTTTQETAENVLPNLTHTDLATSTTWINRLFNISPLLKGKTVKIVFEYNPPVIGANSFLQIKNIKLRGIPLNTLEFTVLRENASDTASPLGKTFGAMSVMSSNADRSGSHDGSWVVAGNGASLSGLTVFSGTSFYFEGQNNGSSKKSYMKSGSIEIQDTYGLIPLTFETNLNEDTTDGDLSSYLNIWIMYDEEVPIPGINTSNTIAIKRNSSDEYALSMSSSTSTAADKLQDSLFSDWSINASEPFVLVLTKAGNSLSAYVDGVLKETYSVDNTDVDSSTTDLRLLAGPDYAQNDLVGAKIFFIGLYAKTFQDASKFVDYTYDYSTLTDKSCGELGCNESLQQNLHSTFCSTLDNFIDEKGCQEWCRNSDTNGACVTRLRELCQQTQDNDTGVSNVDLNKTKLCQCHFVNDGSTKTYPDYKKYIDSVNNFLNQSADNAQNAGETNLRQDDPLECWWPGCRKASADFEWAQDQSNFSDCRPIQILQCIQNFDFSFSAGGGVTGSDISTEIEQKCNITNEVVEDPDEGGTGGQTDTSGNDFDNVDENCNCPNFVQSSKVKDPLDLDKIFFLRLLLLIFAGIMFIIGIICTSIGAVVMNKKKIKK